MHPQRPRRAASQVAPDIVANRRRQRVHNLPNADEHITAAIAAHTDPWSDATTIHTDTTPDHALEQAIALIRVAAGDTA